jgi:hypothetical protein
MTRQASAQLFHAAWEMSNAFSFATKRRTIAYSENNARVSLL